MVEKEKTHRSVSKKRVQEFISMARKAGLKSLKVGEIEFELNPVSSMSAKLDKPMKAAETVSQELMPTDEDLLNWSVPDFSQSP